MAREVNVYTSNWKKTGTLINLSKYENKVYRIVGYRKIN